MLTERQIEILQMVADGKKIKNIAKALSIKEQTVKNRLYIIHLKLRVTSTAQAVAVGFREGWLH